MLLVTDNGVFKLINKDCAQFRRNDHFIVHPICNFVYDYESETCTITHRFDKKTCHAFNRISDSTVEYVFPNLETIFENLNFVNVKKFFPEYIENDFPS